MMRLYLYLSITLFSILFSAQAQTRTLKFDLKAAPASLNPTIAYIRVIDNRQTQDHFGYIKDLSAREQKLVTDGPLSVAMEDFFNKHFINVTHSSTDTLMFIIRNMYVEHRPANTDLGTIYIHADYYRGQNDVYHHLYHIDSFYQEDGRTITGLLSRVNELLCSYTSKALQDSLYNTSSATFSKTTAVSMVADAQKQYPLYNTQEYKKGVYLTWQEMLMLTPSITNFKMVYPGALDNAAPGPYYIHENGKRAQRIKEHDYYAVYDGRKWHKPLPDENAEIKFKNGEYYINARLSKPVDSKEMLYTTLFGLTGYIIYNATKPTPDYKNSPLYGKFMMKIDYTTGKLIPVRMVP